MATPSVLLHPIRLRIVQAIIGEGELTTHQLHKRLSDVPIATLYRHVSHLVEHELIEVAEERQIRGASEKTYRVAPGFANPSPEELSSLSHEELLTAFTVFASGLIQDFGLYLQTGKADLYNDKVSFAQASFWASDKEVDEFSSALTSKLEELMSNHATPSRRRRTLSTVLLPRAEGETEDDESQKAAQEASKAGE